MNCISFIIPAYNAEPFIQDCLDSIFMQNIDNKEIIVINDGSTDNTDIILENYSTKHDIIIKKQENKGLSCARNAGLEIASGEYVCFVDADDVLIPDKLNDLLHFIENKIDIIGIDIRERNFKGETYPYRRYIPEYNKVYKAAEFMKNRNLMPCVPAYIYRREFLYNNNLRFLPGIYHEDEEFTPRAFALADSFVAVNITLYERILRQDSITTTTDVKKQQRKLRDMVLILKRLKNMNYECMQCKLDWLAVDTLRLLLRQHHTQTFKREIVGELKSIDAFPLKWKNNIKHIAFNLFTRIIFQ